MATPLAVFVFLFVAFVHSYRMCIPILSKVILKKLKLVAPADEEKRAALQALLDQQSEISMKEEFAKYAKLDRRINKLKEELKALKHSQVTTRFTISWAISLSLNLVYTIFIVGLIWTYRYEPIVLLRDEWTWPLGRIIAFPCSVRGAVGITSWLAICSAIVARLQGAVSHLVKLRTESKTLQPVER